MRFSKLQKADIIADIYFLLPEEDGRKYSVPNGFRANHDFGIAGMLNDAMHQYVECESVPLGNNVEAYLLFLCPEYQEERLFIGMEFTVREGGKIIGKGKIKKVINSKLEKNI